MVVIIVAAALGASAYTSGTVERSSNVNVVSDDVGLIALEDGTSGDLVSQDSGELRIDFSNAKADGVNANATYKLGNPDDATNQSAFNITNLDTEPHSFNVSYTAADTGDADDNIQFLIYDSQGTEVAMVSEETASATLSEVASGNTHYVVIVVDTHGVGTGTDLSGTLTVSA